MKKLSVLGMLILVAMFSFTAKADVITLDGANEIANAFFANSASSQKRALKSAAQLEYAWDSNSLTQTGSSMMKSADEDPTFYVFNNPDGEGFVIVSGDSNARSVIGYSYEGSVPMADEIPDPMKDYLLGIDEEIKWARTNLTSGNSNLKATLNETGGTQEQYLETPSWGQNAPFNNLCPIVKDILDPEKNIVGEALTKTGCVPTAFASVMRFHKWPLQGKNPYATGGLAGSWYYDQYNGINATDARMETINHSAVTYDWDNMPMTYSSSWTETQKTQVATLMRNVGYAFDAEFGIYSTNWTEGDVPPKVLNSFDYTCDGFITGQFNEGTDKSIDEWLLTIKGSLDKGFPIPYAANNSGTGDSRHMFVVDGYTSNNYFHFNFGWGGSGNGWFLITAVTPSQGDNYSWKSGAKHRAYINFRPNKKITISVATDPATAGSVTINGASVTSKEVEAGTQVTLQATESNQATGNNFYGWMVGNDVVSTENPYIFTATATQTYTAKFLSVGNTVEIYHDYLQDDEDIKANCSVTGLEEKGALYPLGVNLTITANCERGYKFNGWYTVDWNTTENILLSTENPYSFETSEELAAISYSFTKLTPASFTVTTADADMGTATWSFQGAQGAVYAGDEITLTATPKSGYMFTGWSDGTSTISSSKTCTVAVEEGKTYTANFALAGADYIVSYETGTFSGITYNSNSRASVWKYNTSETNPVLLQLTATNASGAEVGAIYKTSNRLYAYGGDANNSLTTPTTYTLSVPDGFIITGYTLDYIVGASYSGKVTIANANSSNTPTDTKQYTLSASNLNDSSTSFTITGNANTQYVTVKSFIVSVLSTGGEPEPEPDPEPEVSEETKALIQSAKTLVALEGIGYPAATAKATLQSAIATAEANPTAAAGTTLQTAIDAYYATNDIVKPEACKTYTFIVGHTNTKSYIYNNNGVLSLATYSGGELPSTAHFTCEVVDGKYQFVSGGKYMPYPKYDNGNLQTTSSSYTKFTVGKILNGGNVTATNQDLFGLVYLEGTREKPNTTPTQMEEAYIVVQYAANANNSNVPSWDQAPSTYGNANFTSAIKIKEVTPVTPTTYTASVTAGNGGTATVNGEAYVTVEENASVTFTATPAQGYRFLGWTKGTSVTYESTDETYNVTVTEDISLVANFEVIQTYTVGVTYGAGGTATVSQGTVEENGTVTLTAKANDGYRFTGWSIGAGEIISTANPYTTPAITADVEYVANFEAIPQGKTPLLTFACLSDLHAQQDFITNPNNIQLRESVTKTLSKIKAEENVDLIVLGGDYTSNNTIPVESWQVTKDSLINATRRAFNGTKTPVIYVNGNHEYEVANYDALPKSYNAGEYYGTPMKTDIGALAAEDCFYETASNGTSTSVELLAAYHYVVNGFDFVVLNTGKNFFASASDYTYSDESVDWVRNKLAQICLTDKNKTIFFLVHIPFYDSNSISDVEKSMNIGSFSSAVETLKTTLAQYPNLVMLYGHDHGKDMAYIRENTEQRVTEYATDGNRYTSYCIQNYNNKDQYLGYNSFNLATTSEACDVAITPSVVTEGAFVFYLTTTIKNQRNYINYINCGSSGRFSGNNGHTTENQQIKLFEVENPDETKITATQATSIVPGKTYMLVGVKEGKYYALTNEMYQNNSTNQRMEGAAVTISSDGTITYTPGTASVLWTIKEKSPAAEKSFISSFMGSMRYYNNSFENGQIADRRIIQALMVYVYPDRVELKMKNYGDDQGDVTANGITVKKDLTPYISYRTVTHSAEAVTATPTITPQQGGVVAPNTEVTVTVDAPEWHNLYYTINGETPTEEVKNGTITFTADKEGDYTVKVAAQEGIRQMSPVASVTYTVVNTHGITVSTNGEGGTASFTIEGDSVILTASPKEGYDFLNWTLNGDVVAETAEATIPYKEYAQYIANFAKQTFTVTVVANPTEGGTVNTITNPVEYGTTLELTATPNSDYQFVNWTLGETVVSTSATFTTEAIKADAQYVANFDEYIPQITPEDASTNFATYEDYSINNIKDNNYSTKFWSNGNQEIDKYVMLDLGSTYKVEDIELYFESGDQPDAATVEISENNSSWTSVSSFVNSNIVSQKYTCNAGKAQARYVRMRITQAKNVWFQMQEFKVYGKWVGRQVTIASNDPELGNASFVHPEPTLDSGNSIITTEDVTVMAVIQPDANSRFVNWTICEDVVGTEATYTYTGIEGATITANFEEIPLSFEVSATASPAEGGNVELFVGTSAPATSLTVEENTRVTFSARANDGYKFIRWSKGGQLVSEEPSYTTAITSTTALVAEFELKTTYRVVVDGGTANGSADSEIEKGTSVTFTATVPSGKEFVNWTSGEDIVSTDKTFTIKLVGDINIIANFREIQGGGEVEEVLPSTSYCVGTAPNNGEGNHYAINKVVAKVNGTEAFTWNGNGSNVEDVSSTCAMEIKAGDVITLVVSSITNESGKHSQWGQAVVYFDWNQDGDWEDSGESTSLYNNPGEVQVDKEYTITVPNTFAWSGDINAFKIRLNSGEAPQYNTLGNATPCQALKKGILATFKAKKTATTTPAPSRTISAIANFADGSAGTVTVNGKSASDTAEGTITLVATPTSNSQFVNWTLNGEVVSSDATITDNSAGNKLYVANFKKTLVITAAYASSQEASGEGVGNGITDCLFDKNESNFWHSQWQGSEPGYPHWFMVKLDAPQMIDAFNYVSRGTGTTTNDGANNGNIVNYQLYISESYIEASSLPTAVKTGTFSYASGSKYHNVTLENPVYGQYVMLYATGPSANGKVNASCAEFYLYASDDYKTQVDLTKVSGANATVKVTTDAPATITVGTSTYTTTAGNLTAEITAQSSNINIVAFGGNITNVDLGENVAPQSFPETVTEITLRNTSADEVTVNAPALEKITVISDANNNVAKVSKASDLSKGVQVVVEKEIKTPETVNGATPTIFNFLSMPFAFNTADIEYLAATGWAKAKPEKQIRILLYDSQERANGELAATCWRTLKEEEYVDIAANQGFVIVGSKTIGQQNQDYKMKLRFTSATEAYNGSVETVTAKAYRNESGAISSYDTDWNFNGVPFLTNGLIKDDYTLYFHNGKGYEASVPAEGKEIAPYQSVMYQADVTNNISKMITVTPASSVSRATNAAEDVFAKAYIAVDNAAPAKIILSDESSENFVVNEDAWYLAPTANAEPAAYFNIGGSDAAVTVQPAASELPMTVYTGAGTQHRITLAATDGNYDVYLKDAVTDEVVCLNDEDYTFTATAKTTIANRFTVSMIELTGIIEAAREEGTIKAVVVGDVIKLYGTEEGDEVTLYNTNGMVITNTVAEDGVTTIPTSAEGVIIIKVAEETVKVVK